MGQTSSIQIVQSTDSEDQIIHYFTSQNNIDFISCDQEGKNVLHWAASSGLLFFILFLFFTLFLHFIL